MYRMTIPILRSCDRLSGIVTGSVVNRVSILYLNSLLLPGIVSGLNLSYFSTAGPHVSNPIVAGPYLSNIIVAGSNSITFISFQALL
jgi:hypothetical protein